MVVIPVHCDQEPTTAHEEVQHRYTVVELLAPARNIYDEFEGILCKTNKGTRLAFAIVRSGAAGVSLGGLRKVVGVS